MVLIEELVKKIPMTEKLLEIKGGVRTVSGFPCRSEVISAFNNPEELQKLARIGIG